ncbi:helicase associated domain-containing protein, partial [Streptomyces sp. NPDC046984]|uniref:helicase associated domain-containing protein n=1 Tax=Streptomyces sp. NPDC046984 TaxID=3155138 RepID=UPI0034092847
QSAPLRIPHAVGIPQGSRAVSPCRHHALKVSKSRLEALEEIDPGWCPVWNIGWQRYFRLSRTHLEAGGQPATRGGALVVQGEDLGAWAIAQRLGWNRLLPAQQRLLDSVLGLEPAGEEERRAHQNQDDKLALNVAAARQYHAREGHLTAHRKLVEEVDGMTVRLGSFLDNARRRAAKLTEQRRADLDQLGMRW